MKRLSTGDPSTLGSYLKLARKVFGPNAVEYLEKKVAEAPNGEDEEVLADETQMVHALGTMDLPPLKPRGEGR